MPMPNGFQSEAKVNVQQICETKFSQNLVFTNLASITEATMLEIRQHALMRLLILFWNTTINTRLQYKN